MRRRSVLVLSAVVVGLLAYTPVDRADCAGDPVETIDVPSFRASVATQQTQVWCWAACIEMVINHNLGSRVVSQQEIVTRNYGAPVALPAMSWAQIWANLNILVPNPNGFDYQLSAVSVNGPLDGATAERELKAGRPFLVGVNGQSHVVTCYGAKIRTGPGGAKSIEAIHLFDPWPTSGDKWVTKTDWPQHASYRWETSIVVRHAETNTVSHTAAIAARVGTAQWQVVASNAMASRIRCGWQFTGVERPLAVWFRTFKVVADPMTGLPYWGWIDTRCVPTVQFDPATRTSYVVWAAQGAPASGVRLEGPQAALFDVPYPAPIAGVNLLGLEYARKR